MKAHGMLPSMSRPANPYDNAFCETFMKTLKHEEVRCRAYQDLDELAANLKEFIDNYYNRLRLHSALGYLTPEEFEAAALQAGSPPVLDAVSMTYFIATQKEKETGTKSTDPTVSSGNH
jgi:transposase InsO family protein